ncbi:MAG TPA: DUF1849 family protein [Alphaproteobacteria bacterium]|jgi:hypothetical protein
MRTPLLVLAIAMLAAPAAAEVAVTPDLVAKVQPHRAIYSLKAKTVSPTGGVADADGAISYELGEECGRWLTKHTFLLNIVRHDAKERSIRTDYTSWEAKDGLTFGFETRTKTDGRETELRTGRAELERIGGPGKAVIEGRGPRKEIALPPGTSFPNWHILELITAGRAGEKIIWRNMFDGSSEGKINGVHAVVVDAVPAAAIQPAALFAHPGFRLKLTFFDPPQEDKERANYKVDMTVNEAGVTTAMVLEYSDFSLEAKIEKIETLPRPACR